MELGNVTSARKLTIAAVFICLIVLLSYLTWQSVQQSQESEKRALAEARVMGMQIDSAWDYIDSIQDRINYSNGVFDFKNVYCSVSGKSIARRFSERSDYSIRYVRENPRAATDEPDEFERSALRSFAENGETEYYGQVEQDGRQVFRYLSVLRAEPNCLDCHGSPAGEKDLVGYEKEGMGLGDVAGAVSITIPMASFVHEAHVSATGAILFFCLLLSVFLFAFWKAVKLWAINPIEQRNRVLYDEAEVQKKFLSTVSHEMKTPLSSIIAGAELPKKSHHAGPVPPFGDCDKSETLSSVPEGPMRSLVDCDAIVDEVMINGEILLRLVENTLDAMKFESGKMRCYLEPVDVMDVVGCVVRSVLPLAEKEGVVVELVCAQQPPIVESDCEALRKIATNLVVNAVRYTPRGGEVSVKVSYNDGTLTIEVADTGPGIEPEQQEIIFERFASTRQIGGPGNGTGLGLSIAREYARMLGGDLRVQSAVGEGSVFSFSAPAVSRCCGEGWKNAF